MIVTVVALLIGNAPIQSIAQQEQPDRVEVKMNWATPELSLPTSRCGDGEPIKMRISSGRLSGMEMTVTPSLKPHVASLISLTFHGQSVSTVVSGDHVALRFKANSKADGIVVSIDSGKPRQTSLRLAFWKELDGSLLNLDVHKAE